MPRAGGEADKLGNHYEAIWTVNCALDVFENRYRSITVEALGSEAIGVEFHLIGNDGVIQFHSVKRQKTGGDWSITNLCKPDKRTNRSIIGDLFGKRTIWPNAQFRFVSATGANDLRELAERAVAATTSTGFLAGLPPKLRPGFDRLTSIFNKNQNETLVALKALEVILGSSQELIRTVERRIFGLFNRIDGSLFQADDVRRMLAEFFLGHLGQVIDKQRLNTFFQDQGIGVQDWKLDQSMRESVATANRRFVSAAETELINAAHITRQTVSRIVETVLSQGSKGALITAPGGYGKSCVLVQCISKLSEHKVPYLCLRMDAFESCQTARQLGGQLDLRASPAVVLAGIADNQLCVLVVDQLDAMSLISGRQPALWQAFQDLCDEVSRYPRMKLILACRDFDLEHDHRLRNLGDPKLGYTRYTLVKLTESEVHDSLAIAGLGTTALATKQLDILSIPFHLLLFLQGDPANRFATVGELYDRYWDRKKQRLRSYLGRDSHWNEVIDALTAKMSERQLLSAPKVVTDTWSSDAKAMVSEHVLIESQQEPQYRFFHESFFDYAYARRFCASGQSVLALLTSSEQQLFRRAQVRQILAYRRENEFTQYLDDVRAIFASPDVRFHVKRMVATEFNRIDLPKREEWQLIEPILSAGDLAQYLHSALRDHEGWFDLMDELGNFENWLASENPQTHRTAVWFLEAPRLHDLRSTRIAELIRPHAFGSQENQRSVRRIFSWGSAYKSEAMATLFLDLIRDGAYDSFESGIAGSTFWDLNSEAEKNAPRFVIDVLAAWFDRTISIYDDGEHGNYFDQCKENCSHNGAVTVCEVAALEPDYFVEQMLPRAKSAILKTEMQLREVVLNRTWPWLSNSGDPFDINDAVLLALRRSLQRLAKEKPDVFRQHIHGLQEYAHETFSYLLLSAFAHNPTEFADDCARYLIVDQRRLNVGYGSWSGSHEDGATGESAVTRTALLAISQHCTLELFQELESKIIGYCDDYEKRTPRQRGYGELLVLRSLCNERVSQRTKLRIEELERKFPTVSDAIVQEESCGMAQWVGSPIPPAAAEKMTDAQWILAMQKYNSTTSDRMGGGSHELAQILGSFAAKNPDRFSQLAIRMPQNVLPLYFSAILDGICVRHGHLSTEDKLVSDERFSAIPTNQLIQVIETLHALPNRPCGSAVVSCIRRIADRELPLRVLEIVNFYAKNDPDPKSEIWQASANGSKYYNGCPLTQGINTVRGQAAETIASLLHVIPDRIESLRPALESLAVDPSISVRTCAIQAFSIVLNTSRDEAVKYFLIACGRCIDLCATSTFDRFVYHAMYTHYPAICDLLQFCLASENLKAVEIASKRITLASLDGVDIGSDAERICSGSDVMRQAAASVYAQNISHASVGSVCALRLETFLNDDSTEVRKQVSNAFFRMSGERLLELQAFVLKYIESRCFEAEPYRLLHALEESTVQLPLVICRAAERVLEFYGDNRSAEAQHGYLAARTMATLIIRQYEQATDDQLRRHCLDLIDSMERSGAFGISGELEKIER
jgi:hypothetical protein